MGMTGEEYSPVEVGQSIEDAMKHLENWEIRHNPKYLKEESCLPWCESKSLHGAVFNIFYWKRYNNWRQRGLWRFPNPCW